MKKFLSLLAMLLVAASAWSLPFEPTSDASDPSTKWYYIKTGDHYMFADSDDGLAPSTNATTDDHYQWCFIGDETSGYNIYNRGTGGFIAGTYANGTTLSSKLCYVELGSGNSFYIYFVVHFGQTSQTMYIRYDSSYNSFLNEPSPSAFTAVEVTPPIPPTEQPYAKLIPIDFDLPFNANNAGHEGFDKLIDQNKNTKWCVVNDGGGWETIWMEFMSDAWFIPNGYILTTGDDTQSCPNRNPKEWILYGKTFPNDEWAELAHVTDGGGLEAKNTTDYTFPITGVTQGCRHFRFEVRQINGKEAGSNNYTFQLAELALSGTRVTPPEPSGNIVFSDLDVQDHYCTLSVSYSGDEEHQLTLKVNGETVENPYTITRTNEVQTLQVEATVTFTDGYDPLTTSITYEIPALEGTEPVTEITLTATAAHTPNNVQTDPAEDYHKLFDKNKSTKWCVDNSTGSWETIWVDFKSNTPFFPTGYTMTTGNDTQSWKGRNPKKWKIYAKAREADDWTTIVDVTDGAAEGLGTNNTTDYSFDINGVSKKYQYFRFEVSEVCGKGGWQSDHYVFQLAELALSGTLEGTEPVTVTGDLTGDGLVDIADVNAVINMMLGKASPTAAGDVTGDGTVDIADVNAVINIMLGKVQPSGGDSHEYVNLGLPSGTLWATMNIGASSPEGTGDYFAWGETEAKDFYGWNTYQWCNGSENTLTKYCTTASYGYDGFVDNKTELDREDDAAYVKWGSAWRIPSKEQFEELYNNCSYQWTQVNGAYGFLFTASNGATLFLPAKGRRWNSYYADAYTGFYWSRTLGNNPSLNTPDYASHLEFVGSAISCKGGLRSDGYLIRPVRAPRQ